jgi:hypothetical protein
MAPINGGMKGIDAVVFFSSGGGVGVDPGGGTRPAGDVVRARLWCRRKKKVAGWAVRMGWSDREAKAQWGREEEKRPVGKKEWAVAGLKGRMGRK